MPPLSLPVLRLARAARVLACLALPGVGLGTALAADVGVSISISQPGVYGRVDIGRFPQPTVVLQQPVLVAPRPVAAAPVYLWVPPGHRQHWHQHCARYNACGAPVYFVRDDWYQRQVMGHPHHREGRTDQARWDDRGDRAGRGHGEHDRGHGSERGQGHRD